MLLMAMLSITSSFSQTEEEIQKTYEKVKDWAVVKLTIAYMEDLKGWDAKLARGESKKEFKTYKELLNNYSNYTSDVNLSAVSEKLTKGDWKTTKTNVFDEYKSTIADSKDVTVFKKIKPFGYNDKIKEANFKAAIIQIQSEYNNLLPKNKIIKSPPKKVSSKGQPLKIKADSNILLYVALCGLIISIILNIILFSKNKKKFSEKRPSSSSSSYNSMVTNRNHQLKEENSKLKEENTKLKEKPQGIHSSPTHSVQEPISQPIELEVPVNKQVVNTIKTIYLPRPQEEKLFLNKHAEDIKNAKSFYEVVFDEKTKIGDLKVIEGVDFTRALSSPEKYFEKACSYDNEYKNNARRVEVTEKGKIILEGENWIVKEKVRIKFI